MTTEPLASDIIGTFLQLPWHGSELVGFEIGHATSAQALVTFDIVFHAAGSPDEPTEVRFNEARGIYTDIDLLAKRLCSDHIASGYCQRASDSEEAFVRGLDERFDLYRGETMDGLFVFGIDLIHPAGEILVLARSFTLSTGSSMVADTA